MNAVLTKFQSLLPRHHFTSAKALAAKAEVSIPTVYRRLRRLGEEGAVISETKSPRKKTGPVPVMYRLLKPASGL